MTKEERLEKQKRKLSEMRVYEDSLRRRGYRYIAGVDEAGRGPLAGPVVAAAVILPEDFDVLGVDDSKKLSVKKREQLFGIIQERAVAYGIGVADEKVIDEINILQATKAAMEQALCEAERRLQKRQVKYEAERRLRKHQAKCETPGVADLAGNELSGQSVLEDSNSLSQNLDENSQPSDAGWQRGEDSQADTGWRRESDIQMEDAHFHNIDYVLFDAMKIETLDIPQESIVKGDAKILAIAAASILAKVTRDRMMAEYAKQYPGYSFEKNKGYGTKAHYAGLAAHGICPIHRRSFLKKWQAGQER